METNHPVTSRIRHPQQTPKAKRKAESWERSVGTLGSRPQLSGLVVKKTGLDTSIHPFVFCCLQLTSPECG